MLTVITFHCEREVVFSAIGTYYLLSFKFLPIPFFKIKNKENGKTIDSHHYDPRKNEQEEAEQHQAIFEPAAYLPNEQVVIFIKILKETNKILSQGGEPVDGDCAES